MSVLDQLNAATSQNADQRSNDWFDQRATRATASIMWKLVPNPNCKDSKKFLDEHFGFHKGAVTVIKEKAYEKFLGEAFKDDLENVWAINFGKNWEEPAIRFAMKMMDVKSLTASPPFIQWDKYPELAGGSPDFLCATKLGVGEVKSTSDKAKQVERWDTVRSFEDMKDSSDKTIHGAYWQIHSNCLFGGSEIGTFVSFCPSYLVGYTDDREYLDFSVEKAFEETSQQNKEIGCHIITGEVNKSEFEIIEDTVVRFGKLRDKFYEELLDRHRKPIAFKI